MKTFFAILFLLLTSASFAQENINKVKYIDQRLYESTYDNAIRYLQNGQIEDAFPLLKQYAHYGEKFAQFAYGGFVLQQANTLEQQVEGIAWMQLALEQRNQIWQEKFDAIYQNLDASIQQAVQQRHQALANHYGVDAQHMRCRDKKETGSNLRFHACTKVELRSGLYGVVE